MLDINVSSWSVFFFYICSFNHVYVTVTIIALDSRFLLLLYTLVVITTELKFSRQAWLGLRVTRRSSAGRTNGDNAEDKLRGNVHLCVLRNCLVAAEDLKKKERRRCHLHRASVRICSSSYDHVNNTFFFCRVCKLCCLQTWGGGWFQKARFGK